MQTKIGAATEYTILKPDTTIKEIELLCRRAIEDKVAAICVPPLLVEKAKSFIDLAEIKIATVISFPFGYSVVEAKLAEVIMAMVDGVDELDVVINMTALKNNDWQYLATELNTLIPVIRKKQKFLKIVVETDLLTEDELIKCCDLYGIAGVDYFSISTGNLQTVPALETIGFVRKHLADAVGIKVSGNFLNQADISAIITAGAARVGQII